VLVLWGEWVPGPILESSTLGRREVVSKHIKFSEESLDALLNEFFLGKESRNPSWPT